jgi:ferredoxin
MTSRSFKNYLRVFRNNCEKDDLCWVICPEGAIVIANLEATHGAMQMRSSEHGFNRLLEEAEKKDIEKEQPSPEKLVIDNPADFQFHAAYLTYSNTFDRVADTETKKQLNENITALQQGQIDYPTFYRNIDKYRVDDGASRDYGRALIKTQKKREWRRKTQKHERIERHRR